MIPQKDNGINILIDSLKQFYDEFKDIKDPILQKQKLEFDLFYNDDLEYRKICLEIEKQSKEQSEVRKREKFNISLHRFERDKQINTSLVWLSLFIGTKVPIQQSATMFKITSDLLDSQEFSLQSDTRMDNKKLIKHLSQEEEKAFNFNMERPIKEYSTKQRKEILKPFKSRFEGIPLDLDLIDTIQNRKPASTKKNKSDISDTGFNLGYTDTQLETLRTALIDSKFLDSNTQLEDFKNAFSGEVLAEDFKPLKWIKNKSVLSLFVGLLNQENKWKIAKSVFENCDSRNLAKSFNNCDRLEKHKPTISFFKGVLK